MQISLPSVQSLLLETCLGEQRIATGTGFVVATPKGPILVTNWHVASGLDPRTKAPLSPTGLAPDRVHILHNVCGQMGKWLRRTERLVASGRPQWIEHPQLGERADVVALRLTQLSDVQLYPHVTHGTSFRVSPADPVSVVGFPFGIQGGGSLALWATGFMASEPDIDYLDLPVFLIDCRARPGQSGSAVIAQRNGGALMMDDGSTGLFAGPVTKFLGVYSGRINNDSDLGMVWKVRVVDALVASV